MRNIICAGFCGGVPMIVDGSIVVILGLEEREVRREQIKLPRLAVSAATGAGEGRICAGIHPSEADPTRHNAERVFERREVARVSRVVGDKRSFAEREDCADLGPVDAVLAIGGTGFLMFTPAER
ncbi:MAG: hypothetical protein EOO22_12710 [Comamonadaceae bacterium]|nr:MAG: hypothetical protein EOO22_12710 [Comamonadaceae bacterium]